MDNLNYEFTTVLPYPKTPEGLYQIIEMVINKLAPKFTFGCYDLDDIKSEGWVKTLELLQSGKYNPKLPFEKLLYRHLNNRLINFRRDNTRNRAHYNLNEILNDPIDSCTPDDVAHHNDVISLIERAVPANLRSDYLRMRDGVKIPEARRQKLNAIIAEVYYGEE